MLAAMGVDITREGTFVRISPGKRLQPLSMRVPNDISAAAFWMVAASVHPDAEVHLTGVGMNPTRTGIVDALRAMGADIAVGEERMVAGEPVADVVVRSATLQGTTVEGEMIPRMVDEVPALAVAAAFATGTTEIRDARELIVKESNRIGTTASEISALGARVVERDDGMAIEGTGGLRGGHAQSHGDHRLAMAMAVAGLVSSEGVIIEGAEAVAVSYPTFWDDLGSLSKS
jgi:3-phosphoshikimate 1-carboxyvinyltransferase